MFPCISAAGRSIVLATALTTAWLLFAVAILHPLDAFASEMTTIEAPADNIDTSLIDFTLSENDIYYLVRDKYTHGFHVTIRSLRSTAQSKFEVPANGHYGSGRIRVSEAGKIAVLLRPLPASAQLLLFEKGGVLASSVPLGPYFVEMVFYGEQLYLATRSEVLDARAFLHPEESGKQQPLLSGDLDYPFTLWVGPSPLQRPEINVFKFSTGTLVSNAPGKNGRRVPVPELLERSKYWEEQGATVAIDGFGDETGRCFLLLPNFSPSDVWRVLELDRNQQRKRLITFEKAHNPETGWYITPRIVRANSRLVAIASLGPARVFLKTIEE